MGDEVQDDIENSFNEEIKNVLNTNHFSILCYDVTGYHSWADDDWDERVTEHAYESPWKKGWMVVQYEDIQLIESKPSIKKAKLNWNMSTGTIKQDKKWKDEKA
jgi:hypothetical protein